MSRKALYLGIFTVIALLATMLAGLLPAQQKAAGVNVGANDVGGVVTSSKGPEAGVWVVAESLDLPTKFVRIVVTDDQGRYLMPDLPKGNFNMFVRGYGLVDSPRTKTVPGKTLDLK